LGKENINIIYLISVIKKKQTVPYVDKYLNNEGIGDLPFGLHIQTVFLQVLKEHIISLWKKQSYNGRKERVQVSGLSMTSPSLNK
jgi:hypothetical protein